MDVELGQVEPQLVVVERQQIPMDGMPAFFDRVFGEIVAAVAAAGGTVVGPPFGWYHGMPTETVDVSAGFPVQGLPVGSLEGELVVMERPGGQAATTMHVGPYDSLAQSYERVAQYVAEQTDLVAKDEMWEEYLTDPSAEPDPTTWQTRIVQPVR
jgi:effector-binding domain-containing protein